MDDAARAKLATLRTLFEADARDYANLTLSVLRYWTDARDSVTPCPGIAPVLERPYGGSYAPGWACYSGNHSTWQRFRHRAERAGKWLRKQNLSPLLHFRESNDSPLAGGDELDWLAALFNRAGHVKWNDCELSEWFLLDGETLPYRRDESEMMAIAKLNRSKALLELAQDWPRNRPLSHFVQISDAFLASVSYCDWLLIDLPVLRAKAAAEMAETDEREKQPKLTVNERMMARLATDPESKGWSARKWADELNCCNSTVADTPAWTALKVVKADAAIRAGAQPKDRRRKSKASDTKREE